MCNKGAPELKTDDEKIFIFNIRKQIREDKMPCASLESTYSLMFIPVPDTRAATWPSTDRPPKPIIKLRRISLSSIGRVLKATMLDPLDISMLPCIINDMSLSAIPVRNGIEKNFILLKSFIITLNSII